MELPELLWADTSNAELREHLKQVKPMRAALHPQYTKVIEQQLRLRKQKRQELGSSKAYKQYMEEQRKQLPPDHTSYYMSYMGPVFKWHWVTK